VAVGDTVEEVEKRITEAIEMHIAGLQLDGDPVPEPVTCAATIEVEVAAGEAGV
jgi:predicted RNase H-like HicB family nuclease